METRQCMAWKWRGWGLALVAALFVVAGCGKQAPAEFKATNVTGAPMGRDFRLTDHDGKTRTLSDFKGKVVAVFFGYTHCPDVCPTTLGDLAQALKKLGDNAGKVQVLFITLDPERDTPELLAQFVPAFNPGFLGLYGDAATTAKTAEEFKVIYHKQPDPDPAKYTIDHSSGTFLYDPTGRLRLFASHGQGAEAFAHDIGLLLEGN